MGLFKTSLIFIASSLIALESSEEPKHHALFMMQQNATEEALDRYREYTDRTGRHDFEVLQSLGLILFRQGIQSQDADVFTMTLFGAGLSGSVGAMDILERGIHYPDPQIQMIALHFIAKINDDKTDEILNEAMNSDFLSTRMEAAFYLAQKKHPYAVGQIEGLMMRLPPFFKPFFPSLFALTGTAEAMQELKRMLDDLDPQVRVESILNIAQTGRDDMLPLLRRRLTHTHVAELEACCHAMGLLKDSLSVPKLKKLARSPSDNVKIAAILALKELGDKSHLPDLIELASRHNLYAISALGKFEGAEEALAQLTRSGDLQVRVNATIALLARHDARAAATLPEILLTDVRDLAFYPSPSVGRTIAIWKAVPSAELRSKDTTLDLSLSLSLREQIFHEAIHLPEKEFCHLCRLAFEKQQNDLVPLAVSLLENLRTPAALALLKEGCGKIGSPLIRDYCHLALFRLKEEGPYESYINTWVMKQKNAELIKIRPMLPWKMRLNPTDYALTAEETSRLLIESFLAIASRQDEKSITFMLDAIKSGNPMNRYALFGLLMRATE